MPLRYRVTKKVGCSYELAITFDKKLPEDRARSTLCLKSVTLTIPDVCFTKTMLSALLVARRVSRKEDNMEATVVQMHQSGAAPQVCVHM